MEPKTQIPNYFVYGEPERALDVGFVHVELVSTRKNLHRGQVEAHQHASMAQITYWTKGSGTYTIEDQTWTFSAPAISFVPSGVVHGFSVSESADAIVVSIANDAVEDVMAQNDAPKLGPVLLTKNKSNIAWLDLKILMNMLLKEYQGQDAHVQSTITHLAAVTLNLVARGTIPLGGSDIKQPASLAQGLRQLVELHFREIWTVEKYATSLNTTYHLLDKAAREGFGKPMKQLIVERRILEAKRLLKFTIRSAESIAYELGFDDPAYFNRQFKKITGFAPGKWRKHR